MWVQRTFFYLLICLVVLLSEEQTAAEFLKNSKRILKQSGLFFSESPPSLPISRLTHQSSPQQEHFKSLPQQKVH